MLRSSYSGEGIKPERDWRILLTFGFFSLIITMLFSFYFYKQISAGKLFTIEQDITKKEVKINSAMFKKVIDDVRLREETLLEIKQNKSIPPNPAL